MIEYHLIVRTDASSTKLVKVQALDYKKAVTRACSLYPGKFINYKSAKIVDAWLQKQHLIKNSKPMKMFSSTAKNLPLIEAINDLITDLGSALCLVEGGNCYLLREHHQYLNPVTEAKRMRLGPVYKTDEGVYYFYEIMNLKKLKALHDPKPKAKLTPDEVRHVMKTGKVYKELPTNKKITVKLPPKPKAKAKALKVSKKKK